MLAEARSTVASSELLEISIFAFSKYFLANFSAFLVIRSESEIDFLVTLNNSIVTMKIKKGIDKRVYNQTFESNNFLELI